jgi:hypothetical protein
MTHSDLDLIFPFVVFAYGAVMTLVLNMRFFMDLADQRFPQQLVQQLNAHRGIGFVCLLIGGVWSLQNLWF